VTPGLGEADVSASRLLPTGLDVITGLGCTVRVAGAARSQPAVSGIPVPRQALAVDRQLSLKEGGRRVLGCCEARAG